MTRPRPIRPGSVVCVTRRTSERRFYLRPDKWVRATWGYLLATLAPRFEVDVIVGVMMSDHYHLVVHDKRGRLPEFVRELNVLMARVVNHRRKRTGNVWDTREPHYQVVLDAGGALSVAAYVLANPVAAGAVKHGRDWPGFRTSLADFSKARVYRRPKFFASARDPESFPSEARLLVRPPPWWSDGGPGQFARELFALVESREARARQKLFPPGPRVSSADDARRRSWRESARSPESAAGRRESIVTANAELRTEYLTFRRKFWSAYDRARRSFLDGVRDVVFPAGTWLMTRLFGLPMESLPA